MRAIRWFIPLSSTALRFQTPGGSHQRPAWAKVAKHRLRARVNIIGYASFQAKWLGNLKLALYETYLSLKCHVKRELFPYTWFTTDNFALFTVMMGAWAPAKCADAAHPFGSKTIHTVVLPLNSVCVDKASVSHPWVSLWSPALESSSGVQLSSPALDGDSNEDSRLLLPSRAATATSTRIPIRQDINVTIFDMTSDMKPLQHFRKIIYIDMEQ